MFAARNMMFARSSAGYDADAADNFDRIIAAGSSISTENKAAVNDFVVGCKADGTWDAIKALCLLAGADTLAGALVPLVGPAPTNYNFVDGDYSRTTGLIGDGSAKYLDSGRNNNAESQNNQHMAVSVSAGGLFSRYWIGAGVSDAGSTHLGRGSTGTVAAARNRSSTLTNPAGYCTSGFAGMSRSTSTNFDFRGDGATTTNTRTSSSPFVGNILIFARGSVGSPSLPTDARLSFYSIGESLDLALLDARLTTYMASLT